MSRKETAVPILATPLDEADGVPLYQQLYDRLRGAILGGSLLPGTRLPSTRRLGADLGIARNTVLNAYEQLHAEGYLDGEVGSGTYVSRALPEHLLHAPPSLPRKIGPAGKRPALSRRGMVLASAPGIAGGPGQEGPFRQGRPALDAFPFDVWTRLIGRRWRSRPACLLGYGDPAGYRPLREAIAAYLGTSRGVRCGPDQVVIVAGSQMALDLSARVLLDPGDTAWVEDPGYLGARGALLGAGIRLVPVPVDAEGLDVAAGVARDSGVRLAYVTPSFQYPLGVTMSIARRLALLEWAARAGAWILEDDYDSEYRYADRPLAALQGLDPHGRVIYLGTFSKVLFPSLRLGYLVVPPDLVDAFVRARALMDAHAPTLPQAVVADFNREGHFARHLRRMRSLYAERQEVLVQAAARDLGGLLTVLPAKAGMHLLGWLPEGVKDRTASERAEAAGVVAHPLSEFALGPAPRPGLLLGYTALTPRQIREGVKRLAAALKGS